MRHARIATGIALILSCLLPMTARADVSVEHIQNFHSDIHITKQNHVEITETIDYDFGSELHHGIYRNIPVDYRDPDGKSYHLAFLQGKVTDERGNSIKTERSKSGSDIQLKIGDPDREIYGLHTYKISYALTPVVNLKNGKDHLALDITGNGWTVPIEHASATVTADSTVFIGGVCYAGPAGSTGTAGCDVVPHPSGDQQQLPPLTVTSSVALQPGDGLTVETYLPKGYVDHYLVAGHHAPLTSYDYGWLSVAGLAVLVCVIVALIFAMRQLRERRLKKSQTIIPEYDPPEGLSPAELGTLLDDKSDLREITATLIDLAVRGYIKIEQTAAKSLFRKAKYRIIRLRDYADTQSYEQQLLGAIFSRGPEADLDKLDKTLVAGTITRLKGDFKDRLKTRGFYGSFSREKGLLAKVLNTGNITDEGAKEWAKIEGFKWYLSVTEKDRLKFTDAPERTPERFNKLLPFAVALGVEKEWAKQFEGIDVSQATDWYIGYNAGAWTAFALSDDLSSGFTSAVSSNFVSSSGGGSSGGGFGGGGGGSW